MASSQLNGPATRRRRRRDPFRVVEFDSHESSLSPCPSVTGPSTGQALRPRQIKSRSGCEPCKKRHIKCDESQPACLRCQKADITCTGIFKLDEWQVERPWLYNMYERVQGLGTLMGSEPSSVTTQKRARPTGAVPTTTLENDLLRHWFETAWTFMGIVPQSSNPLSYGISSYLHRSRALRHSIQCISQAHLGYFSDTGLPAVLDERSRALASLRMEIEKAFAGGDSSPLRQRCLQTILLSSLMLGITSAWVDRELSGLQFLFGARRIVPLLLRSGQLQDPVTQYILGLYVYWEGVSSHIESNNSLEMPNPQMDSQDEGQAQLFLLQGIVEKALGGIIHPVTGLAAGVFPLMSAAGRYYRKLVQGDADDRTYAKYLETELVRWRPISPPDLSEGSQKLLSLAEAYRALALLLLYQAASISQAAEDPVADGGGTRLAVAAVMDALRLILPADPLLCSVGPFIVIAASELTEDEVEARELVHRVATEATRHTRVTAFTSAFELVQDVWAHRAGGIHVTWLQLMLRSGQCWSFA